MRRSIALLALSSLLGCAKPAPTDAPAIYVSRCVACHGARGAGDGVASAGLTPRPRDFRAQSWQQRVSDGRLRAVILRGGAANGLSAAMPPHPDLRPAEIDEIIRYLRRLRGSTQ